MEKLNKKKRLYNDPNIVYIDLDFIEKIGGARDIIEVKINKAPPVLINMR